MTKPPPKEQPVCSSELLPCPFCGGAALMEEIGDAIGGARKSAGCYTERCMGYQSTVTFSTHREAAKAWNTRWKGNTEVSEPAPKPKA